MKIRILLVAFFLLSLTQINAQDRKFNFGLKVAPAISWLSTDRVDVSSDGASAKFNWGFISGYNFTDNFALVSGFNVNYLGGKLKDDATSVSRVYKYSELQLPAIFQMKSNDIAGFKIYFQVGLAAGVFLNAKEDGHKIMKDTRPLNSAWLVGAGVYVPVAGDINLLGQIKYNGGFTGIGKKGTAAHQTTANFVELGLGVLF